MRRRRRFKGTWFPHFGTEYGSGPEDVRDSSVLYDTLHLGGQDGAVHQTIALLPDEPTENFDDETRTLADTLGSEYALRRIVGKFICAISTTTGEIPSNTVQVGLGFFVSRVDPDLPGLPIGAHDAGDVVTSASDVSLYEAYNPLALAATRQPWIWRRTWPIEAAGAVANPTLPPSNVYFGSVLDGPHIDAKTRRRVQHDERLFAVIGMEWFPTTAGGEADTGSLQIRYSLDLRFFGALRKARNRSAF